MEFTRFGLTWRTRSQARRARSLSSRFGFRRRLRSSPPRRRSHCLSLESRIRIPSWFRRGDSAVVARGHRAGCGRADRWVSSMAASRRRLAIAVQRSSVGGDRATRELPGGCPRSGKRSGESMLMRHLCLLRSLSPRRLCGYSGLRRWSCNCLGPHRDSRDRDARSARADRGPRATALTWPQAASTGKGRSSLWGARRSPSRT